MTDFECLHFTDFQSFQLYADRLTIENNHSAHAQKSKQSARNQLNQLLLLLALLYMQCWLHLVPQGRAHAAKHRIMSARIHFRSWLHFGAHFSGGRLVSERRYSWRNTKSTVHQLKEILVATNTKHFIINQLVLSFIFQPLRSTVEVEKKLPKVIISLLFAEIDKSCGWVFSK